MEALGSPSISRAPMGGSMLYKYRKLVYTDERYNDNIYIVFLPVPKYFKIIT